MLGKRSVLSLICLLIGTMVLITSCGPPENEDQADSEEIKGMPVVVQQLTPETIDLMVTATGVLRSEYEVPIMSEISGTIINKVRDIGDVVQKGDVIVALDAEPYELAYAQAEGSFNAAAAAYDQALRDYQRYVELSETEDVSTYELETAQLAERTAAANLQMAEAAMKLAERSVRLTRLSSPVEGSVAKLDAQVGQQVGPGTPLGRIVATQSLEVEVGLSEREIVNIRKGNRALITTSVYPDQVFKGKVKSVGSAGLDMGRSFPVVIEVQNEAETLKPGMITVVKIIFETRENVVTINRDALVLGEDTPTVYVVVEGVAIRRNIKLGRSADYRIVVEEGLEAGEVLVITGQNVLTDSIKVKIL
ncbi:MAG: efflux RND transporter periplasmic adaptor subunit [bacterium]